MEAARSRSDWALVRALATEKHATLVVDHCPGELLLPKLIPREPEILVQIGVTAGMAASCVSDAVYARRAWRRANGVSIA